MENMEKNGIKPTVALGKVGRVTINFFQERAAPLKMHENHEVIHEEYTLIFFTVSSSQ